MRIHDLRYRTWLQMRLLSVVWKVFLVLPRKIPTRYITNFITYTKTTFKSTFNLTECTYICISHFLNAKMTEQFTGTFPPILHQYWKLSPLSLHHRCINTLYYNTKLIIHVSNSFSTRVCFGSRPNLKNSLFNCQKHDHFSNTNTVKLWNHRLFELATG